MVQFRERFSLSPTPSAAQHPRYPPSVSLLPHRLGNLSPQSDFLTVLQTRNFAQDTMSARISLGRAQLLGRSMLSADVAKRIISFFRPSQPYAYRPLCTSRTYPTGQSRHTSQ